MASLTIKRAYLYHNYFLIKAVVGTTNETTATEVDYLLSDLSSWQNKYRYRFPS